MLVLKFIKNNFFKIFTIFSLFIFLYSCKDETIPIKKLGSNNNNEFHMFCFSDNKYSEPTATMITSVLLNVNEDKILNIHLASFEEDPLNQENKNKILSLTKIRDFKLDIITLEKSKFSGFNTEGPKRKWDASIMVKLFVAELFPNLDKILWLDGDIIVNRNITDLFEKDLNENYFAAVDVSNFFTKYHPGRKSTYWINAGVCLYNLSKMRKDAFQEKLINKAKEYGENPEFINSEKNQGGAEEYALTYATDKNKVLLLPYRYCILPFLDSIGSNLNHFEEEKDEIAKGIIIHFASSYKPWDQNSKKLLNPYFVNIWEKYNKLANL